MARQTNIQYVNFYTAGSAAYRFDPEPVKKQVQLPKPKKRKRIVLRIDPVTTLGACVAFVLLVMMLCGVSNLRQAQIEQNRMAEYVTRLETENAKLEATYQAGYDLDEIYEIATAMGMVPAEQATHIRVQLPEASAAEDTTGWEDFCIFLSGLFA